MTRPGGCSGCPPDFLGRPLGELLPPGRLGDIVRGEISGSDLLVLANDRVLVANRRPIRLDHRRHLGWVVTFHDQTESESLKRELDEAIGLTEALRAQSHEFANRMHTLVGLVELGQYDEAIRFVTDVSAARDALTEQLKAAIRDPKLVALTLAKSSLADERGVQLRVAADCHVAADLTDVTPVLTVAGQPDRQRDRGHRPGAGTAVGGADRRLGGRRPDDPGPRLRSRGAR